MASDAAHSKSNSCGPPQQQQQQQRTAQDEKKERAPPKPSKTTTANLVKAYILPTVTPNQRIPRPPNAFMLFANEHRKILARK